MFDIKELKTTSYSNFSGKAALDAMQNKYTCLLDLLVRESIQNSSDAALKIDSPMYFVLYKVGKFKSDNLSPYFNEIENKLREFYGGEECSFIEIRDRKTRGLDGETIKSNCTNDTKSNFLRLIFDMGKGQDQANAGGNWGYGKTVYYRVGRGIVIYYSRIFNEKEGKYESRMILTLIENEELDDALLKNERNDSAGRAWWGEKKGDDICPITDEGIIKDFLAVFGIEPFDDDETGTSIIIPYVDEEALTEEAKSGLKTQDENDLERCSFLSSVSDYLRYAIQKWYAPIINNYQLETCGKKFLNASVNDIPVRKDEMYPIFKLVQEMYTAACSKTCGKNHQPKYGIICKDATKSWHQRPLNFGCTAFCKIKKQALNEGENLLSPEIYMGVETDKYSGITSLYTRDLGMILNYEESWIKEFIIDAEEILVTLFVPQTEKEEDFGFGQVKLGEYLRQREEADHMRWDDDPPNLSKRCVKIVKTIKSSVEDVIKKHFNPEQADNYSESDMSEFAESLGEKLFPRAKAKKKSSGGGSGGGGGTIKSEKKFTFISKGNRITADGKIKVEFELEIKQTVKVEIKTKVCAGVEGEVDFYKWQEKIRTQYPFKLINFSIDTQGNDTEINWDEKNCNVIVSGSKNKITGTFEIEAIDRKLAFIVDCDEKKEEDN